MQYIISADDYGLSRGITDNILDAFDHGAVTSVSMIANGHAFDYAMAEYKKRKGLRIAVHLNLIEGKSLSPARDIPKLSHPDGMLRCTFQGLVFAYWRGNAKERHELKCQIQQEFSAQIEKVAASLGKNQGFCLDSHQHTHLIPFVFDALLELHERFHFSYIRIPEEPFFLAYDGIKSLKNYFGSGIIKHGLLNFLSRYPRQRLQEMKIEFCQRFLGVLFTGNMRPPIVRAALKSLEQKCLENKIVEIVMHPGGAMEGEEALWKNKIGLREYYYSPWRRLEREALKSEEFKKLFNNRDL